MCKKSCHISQFKKISENKKEINKELFRSEIRKEEQPIFERKKNSALNKDSQKRPEEGDGT